MAETYLTEAGFCERYNVKAKTAQSWRYSGENGPPWVRLGGRRIGYRVSDCEAWAAARTFNSRADEMAASANVPAQQPIQQAPQPAGRVGRRATIITKAA